MPAESKNKTFVLRIDTETMEAIEKWAADEFQEHQRTDSVPCSIRHWRKTDESRKDDNVILFIKQ